ncbi:MAG: aspartate--tRNA ligase [Cyclobacteriaceae bacterium]|nr:aspartate--tRNA ligase [Cyclobacteriaceae bacterium]
MWRTHTCGELRSEHIGQNVILSGWIQRIRDKGGVMWLDLRDRYGITQVVLEEGISPEETIATVRKAGREFVIQVKGGVVERHSKNPNLTTGDIEIKPSEIKVLNSSKTPPFTIEEDTDGGDELRMKYRYLDLRRTSVRNNLELRHSVMKKTRDYLSEASFIEVETPVLIKSTPEGARDFVVPSRMNPGEFYALPQSPQTFKQLLMVSGFDKYFQIVKCFRDEDLRADRQPEFTQIDCEMSFVEREDILNTFEGLTKYLFNEVKNIELGDFPRMSYQEAMEKYGSDKPDIRFGMEFKDLTTLAKGHGFGVFDSSEGVLGIVATGCASYTRKQIDALTEWVKRPQIGAKGLVYAKYNEDGSIKSSVDKFYDEKTLSEWMTSCGAQKGDMLLILSGDLAPTRKSLNELRLFMGSELGLRDKSVFQPLWVVDFPLLEWDEDSQRFHAMHHPFTSPNFEDLSLMESDPGKTRANAYDLVINGVEIGGGSIRIHDRKVQETMFKALGFTPEEANKQFGFLLEAFEYGAPPHGGIAFGFDRLCSLMGGSDSIRDYIAFPKNNSGRDVMIDTPSSLSEEQLNELNIILKKM